MCTQWFTTEEFSHGSHKGRNPRVPRGLAQYIAASSPVAVTRHGQTVGCFIPAHGQAEADLVALEKASQSLDKLLCAQTVDVEDIIADFKRARKKNTPAASAKAN